MLKNVFFIVVINFMYNCHRQETGPAGDTFRFENPPVSSKVEPGFVDEASGMTDSRSVPGHLWVEEDSGNPPDISLLSYDGKPVGKVHLKGIKNRDWEDITIGSGPQQGVNYLYLADIGDNFSVYSTYYIYRFPEPAGEVDTVSAIDRISFRYPDGSNDAEAILFDRNTKDIYIISKRGVKSKLYMLAYPQSTTETMIAKKVGELPFNDVVSAAQSPSGQEIILKTYKNLYHWQKKDNESIEKALSKPHTLLGYQAEPQGEAICFKNDNSGFFTVSEKPMAAPSVTLNFYKRK